MARDLLNGQPPFTCFQSAISLPISYDIKIMNDNERQYKTINGIERKPASFPTGNRVHGPLSSPYFTTK